LAAGRDAGVSGVRPPHVASRSISAAAFFLREADSCVVTIMELYSTCMVWFEWDDAKAKTNERKHGVRFDDAMLVFSDPYALVEQDRIEAGELRWQTLGLVGGVVLLLVAHTVRNESEDEIIRIISARKASRKERIRYDQNRKKESL
jgi:uncharacterized DUF497 family protein